jgi:O-antigen ligase
MSKIYYSILALYLVLAPYLRLPGLRYHDSQRIWQLIILSLISLGFLFQWYIQSPKKQKVELNISHTSPSFLLLGGIFVLGLISVLLSQYREYALLEFSFTFLILFFVVLLSPTNRFDLYRLGRFIFITSIIYSAIYVIIFFGNYITSFLDPMIILWPEKITYSITIGETTLTGKDILYFSNKRFFNHTQSWTFPILFAAIVYFKNQYKNWRNIEVGALFFLTTIWWVLVLASGGRGTLVAVLVSALVIFIISKNDAKEYVKVTFLTLVSGIVFYLLLFIFLPASREAPLLRLTDSNRLDLWKKGLEIWTENPFFGAGPMNYAVMGDSPGAAHPHNYLVQFLSEWGIFAFILLMGILFIFGISTLKLGELPRFKTSRKIIVIGVYTSLFSAILHSLVSGVMHTPMSQIWFILIVAWILAWNNQKSTITYSRHILAIIFTALLVTTLVLVVPDIYGLSEGYFEFIQKYPDSRLWPRFWDQGLIPRVPAY